MGGYGAQFNLMSLTVAIGSGIGILSVAKVICDFMLLYLCGTYHPKYKATKYEDVVELPGEALGSDVLDGDDELYGQHGNVDKENQLADAKRQRLLQSGAADGDDDVAWEKVSCWKMCQVRMCC